MTLKADDIQKAITGHLADLGVPADAWTWNARTAQLTLVVAGKPWVIQIKAGKTTLRDLVFHLGRIQGWWEMSKCL